MSNSIGVNPPDFTTLAGKVRVLTGDTEPTALDPDEPGFGEYAWYSDEELEVLGSMYSDSPKRVAIHVLSIVAINQAMLLKKWTTDDLAVDGPAIIKGIEATLKRLSAAVDLEDVLTDDFFGLYSPVEYAPTPVYGTFEYFVNEG